MDKEEIAKRFCKFELCTHRNGEGMCCLYNQDNCIFYRLEKENAELKEALKGKRCSCMTYLNFKDLEKQLTKAIEIIKGLLSCCRNYPQENAEKMEQAEQFLKGENIILEDAQAGNSPFVADEVFNKEMKAYPDEKVKKEIEK